MRILKLWNKPFVRFVLLCTILFSSLYTLYYSIVQPSTGYDDWLVSQLTDHASKILNIVGFDSYVDSSTKYVVLNFNESLSQGVWVGARCNGTTLFILFFSFIVCFPGRLKNKIWFIPLGLFTLHFINALRISALAYISSFYPESFNINHEVTFYIITWAVVIGLWMSWIKINTPKAELDAPKK